MEMRTTKTRLAFFTPKMSPEAGEWLGVQKKIEGQLRAFEALGCEVGSFAFAPYTSSGNFLKDLARSYAHNRARYNDCLEKLADFHPEAVYIRYSFADSHFLFFLEKLRREVGPNIPIFLEIATYPYDRELRSSGRPGLLYLYLADLCHRGKLQRYIDRLVTFSDYDRIFDIPTIKISNGVDTRAIQPAAASADQNGEDCLQLIGVSNLVFWTGYERMIEGLAEYRQNNPEKNVYLHIVGDGQHREALQALAREKGVTEKVIFHGAHSGASLDKLFQGRHLAIGNLAVHRKGMTTNPDLKNREYCARGLPIVTSTIDPGFPQGFPYLLTVPADESPIDVSALVEFQNQLQANYPNFKADIRSFAEQNFDWSVMLQPVADIFRECRK